MISWKMELPWSAAASARWVSAEAASEMGSCSESDEEEVVGGVSASAMRCGLVCFLRAIVGVEVGVGRKVYKLGVVKVLTRWLLAAAAAAGVFRAQGLRAVGIFALVEAEAAEISSSIGGSMYATCRWLAKAGRQSSRK